MLNVQMGDGRDLAIRIVLDFREKASVELDLVPADIHPVVELAVGNLHGDGGCLEIGVEVFYRQSDELAHAIKGLDVPRKVGPPQPQAELENHWLGHIVP